MQKEDRLMNKYNTDDYFRTEIDENQQKYQQLLQEASYSNFQMVPKQLFRKFRDREIYFYYGYLQKCSSAAKLHKFAIYFLKNFHPKPNTSYSFVFFNNSAEDSSVYNNFRNIFLMLTLEHYIHLEGFYVVRASFMHKAWQMITFGSISKHLKSKTHFLNNSEQLCKKLRIDPEQFINFIPQAIYKTQQHHFKDVIRKSKHINNFRMNIQGQTMNEQELQQKEKFFSEINSFMQVGAKQTHSVGDYDLSPLGIPVILELLIYYFKSNPDGLKQQGLFRKSVSIDQQNETLAELSVQNYDCLQNIKNPHLIANLIKRFFSNLKTPIIPFQQHGKLMHDQGIKDKVEHTKHVMQTLQQTNRLSLIFLLLFLRDQVAMKSNQNKMTIQNLAICFSPCLMRAETPSVQDLIYASKSVEYIKIMLNQLEDVFGDVMHLFQNKVMRHTRSFQQQITNAVFNQARLSSQKKSESLKNKQNSIKKQINSSENNHYKKEQKQVVEKSDSDKIQENLEDNEKIGGNQSVSGNINKSIRMKSMNPYQKTNKQQQHLKLKQFH